MPDFAPSMSRDLTTDELIALLAAGPARLAELTAGLPFDQLHNAPAPGEWSANDVLAHLRACADVWGDAIVAILAQDRPTIRAVNPRTWIESTDYREQAFPTSLRAFAAQRAALVATLETLAPEAWAREAKVMGAGRPLVRTIYTYAHSIAVHERPHLKQIARIVRG